MDTDSRRCSEGDVSFVYQLLAKNEFHFEFFLICVHPVHLWFILQLRFMRRDERR
jgi:hypothetical protein